MTPRIVRPLRCEPLETRRVLAGSLGGLQVDPGAISQLPSGEFFDIAGFLHDHSLGDHRSHEGSDASQHVVGDVVTSALDRLAPAISDYLVAGDWIGPGNGGRDLVQEVNGQLFVVDQSPWQTDPPELYVFQRAADNTLDAVARVQLGMPVQRMIVRDGQVVLIGNDLPNPVVVHDSVQRPDLSPAIWPPPDPMTLVTTVNLPTETGGAVEVIEQRFEGLAIKIHRDGDRIVMVAPQPDQVHIAIFPPPEIMSKATAFEMTADGLRTIGSTEIPLFSITQFRGNDLWVASTRQPNLWMAPPVDPIPTLASIDAITLLESASTGSGSDGVGEHARPDVFGPSGVWSRYTIDADGFHIAQRIELGEGFVTFSKVSDDGTTAIVVRSTWLGVGPATYIDVLDLTGDSANLKQSIELPEIAGFVVATTPQSVVLASVAGDAMWVVHIGDTPTSSIADSVRMVPIPSDLVVRWDTLQVNEDRIVLAAERHPLPVEDPPPPDGSPEEGESVGTVDPAGVLHRPPPRSESVLLTVSISQARVLATTALPEGQRLASGRPLRLIDSGEQRIGVLVRQVTPDGRHERAFLFGRIAAEGHVVFGDGDRIPVQRWLEIDANADRLLVRQPDQLLQYDWNQVDQPIIIPLRVAASDSGTTTIPRDQLDVDGNGEVTPADALSIVNFIGRFGSIATDQMNDVLFSEGETAERFQAVRRYDANGNGMITAHDALLVINELDREVFADVDTLIGTKEDQLADVLPIQELPGGQLF